MPSTGFEFATAGRIVFGPDTASQLAKIVASFGQRVLIVTGASQGRFENVVRSVRANAVVSEVFSVPREPDVDLVDLGATCARELNADVVVAIGGGSAIDGGKAIAALAMQQDGVLEFLEVVGHGSPLQHAPLPFVAVPTTAGTGSEVTRNAVLTVPDARVKASLRSPSMLPRVALVDPGLSLDLPATMTASTGMDALTQVIEPYLSSRANALTDALCRDGIARAARALPAVMKDPGNLAARCDMSLTSLFGGLALANAGLGAVHGFAAPIGGISGAAHGTICATLLPHVLRVNLQALRQREAHNPALARLSDVAALLTGQPSAQPEVAVKWASELAAALRIPTLEAIGVTSANHAEIAQKAARASSMRANPIALSESELLDILASAA